MSFKGLISMFVYIDIRSKAAARNYLIFQPFLEAAHMSDGSVEKCLCVTPQIENVSTMNTVIDIVDGCAVVVDDMCVRHGLSDAVHLSLHLENTCFECFDSLLGTLSSEKS